MAEKMADVLCNDREWEIAVYLTIIVVKDSFVYLGCSPD